MTEKLVERGLRERALMGELEMDAWAREEALDATRSFVVKAPAGSGKTQLLTLRLLALLATVDEPEEVLAITFTRAATAEMRDRVMGALRRAAAGEGEGVESEPARAALGRSRDRGWGLLEQPRRLNIQTIDSLCLQIAHETPLLSRLGGQLQPMDDARELYALAARRTMERLADGPARLQDALTHLLRLRDVSLEDCKSLIAEMLGGRDQWLSEVAGVTGEEHWARLRERLEEPMRREHTRVLAWVKALLRGDHGRRLLELAEYACGNEPQMAIQELRGMTDVEDLVDAGHLRCVRELLLTKGSEWRSKVNKNHGFPVGARGSMEAERKDAFTALIEDLQAIDGLLEALCAVDELPADCFSDEEWLTVRDVFTVLLHAAGQLRAVFAERGAIDFVETGLTAAHALDDPEVRRRWSGQVRHLLVDEFQDTSRRQYELLKRIVGEWEPGDGRSCFLVGDPMQSVYLFRQAEMALFNEVQRHGFGIDADAVTFELLTLRRNFRSTRGIVGPLNALFGALEAREFVPAVADEESADENAVHVAARFEEDGVVSEPSEAEMAVAAIKPHLAAIEQARRDGGEFRVGVLVRAKAHVALIAQALRKAGIAYRAIELETLGERQEVLDLLSLLRALLSPVDRVAWLAVLRAPWCGLTLKDLHVLCGEDDETLMKRAIPELLTRRMGLLSADGQARTGRVFATIQRALGQRFAGTFSGSPVGFAAWMERTWVGLGGRECVDAHGYENVQAFFRLLAAVTPDGIEAGQARLDVKLERLFAQPMTEATEKTGVQLMTIHKAKGLGFDVVLVPGMERQTGMDKSPLLHWMTRTREGSAERELLIAPIGAKSDESSPNYKWVCAQRKREERDEVQRLLYVACTRARRELHLFGSVCVKDGAMKRPTAGSLLAAGWDGLEPGFAGRMAERPVGGPMLVESKPMRGGIVVGIAASSAGQVLRRLPVGWGVGGDGDPSASLHLPTPAHKDRVPGTPVAQDDNPAAESRGGPGRDARGLGVVVHALLQQMASLEEQDGRREVSVSASATYWRNVATALLRQQGFVGREVGLLAGQAVGMLGKAARDPEGRWILGARREGRNESGWSAASLAGVRNLRADRVFLAGDSPLAEGETHLWIVDYKTGVDPSDGQGDGSLLPGMIADERARHAAQLAEYGRVLGEALPDQLPMRLALYYPAVPHLDWWPA